MASVLLMGTLFLPGYIAKKIYAELQLANERIAAVETELNEVKRTNELLEQLRQERLQTLDPINQSLIGLQAQLETMESIDASLKKLDQHLASLRRTIENIDSTIPFLKIADPSEDEVMDEEGEESADQEEAGARPSQLPEVPAEPSGQAEGQPKEE